MHLLLMFLDLVWIPHFLPGTDYDHRCGITIMIAMPLNLLPCREALLEVVDVWFHYSHHRAGQEGSNPEEQGCWRLFHRLNSTEDVEGQY